jgi:hypothetical protein
MKTIELNTREARLIRTALVCLKVVDARTLSALEVQDIEDLYIKIA